MQHVGPVRACPRPTKQQSRKRQLDLSQVWPK